MKDLARIKFLVAAMVCAVLGACAAMDFEDMDYPVDTDLVVLGNVYSLEDGKPLKGIRVVMSSYSKFDTGKTLPQRTDTCYTDHKGAYTVSVHHVMDDDFYDIVATDVDGNRNKGLYEETCIEFIEWNGKDNPLYDQDILMKKL